MYKEILKEHIIRLRKEAKMSKKDLAKMIGISLPKYYRFQKSGIITLDELNKACEVFGLCIQIIPKRYAITNL